MFKKKKQLSPADKKQGVEENATWRREKAQSNERRRSWRKERRRQKRTRGGYITSGN